MGQEHSCPAPEFDDSDPSSQLAMLLPEDYAGDDDEDGGDGDNDEVPQGNHDHGNDEDGFHDRYIDLSFQLVTPPYDQVIQVIMFLISIKMVIIRW